MTSRTPRTGAFPAVLDPVLAVVERLDRLRRRLRPVRPGGLLAIEERTHRGPDVRLRDGTAVHRGARIWAVHFDNSRLGELGTAGWQSAAYAVARADLHSMAALLAGTDADRRPVAITGVTLLAPLVVRAGFEARDRPLTPWTRLEDRYLRSLLGRWAPGGRSRLARGHAPLRSRQVWLSADALIRRYGPSDRPSGPPP